MVDLTALPLVSSFLSSTTANAAASTSGAQSFDALSSNMSPYMSQDSGTTASFKETLAGLQSSDATMPAKADPAALLPGTVAAEKGPASSQSNSMANSLSALPASARSPESTFTGSAFSLIAQGYSAAGGSATSRFSQLDSAVRQTAGQEPALSNSIETRYDASDVQDTAEADNLPSRSAAELPSAVTALVDSMPAGTGFSSPAPAIGKLTAAPGQVAGARGQNSEPIETPVENALSGGKAAASPAVATEVLGNVASLNGADGLKRKKKADDHVSPNLNRNASSADGAAAFQPLAAVRFANDSTSGVSGQAAGVSSATLRPSATRRLDEPSSESGLKNDDSEANNTPGSDFAFAVRFKSDASAQSSSVAGSGGTGDPGAAAGANANEKTLPQAQTAGGVGAAELKMTAPGASGLTGATGENLTGSNAMGLVIPAAQHGGQPASSSATDAPATTGSSSVQESKPASDSAPPALRSLQVQITGQDNQRVDVKLIERPGVLSMSVRAADGSLTRSLQEHLPELTTKLAEQQMPAEWWVPKSASAAPAGEAASSGDTTKQGDSRSQGQSGSGGGHDSGKQQGGRQGDQPNWVNELAAMNNSKTTRKEYIWHQ